MRSTLFLALLGAPGLAHAAPGYVPIQGTLADSSGVAIDGQVDVTFTLYSDSAGSLSLWSDTMTLDVVNGRFATELGGGTALDLDTFANYPSVHLQIQVTGDSAMPLVPLDHVPYAAAAITASSAESLQGLTLADIRAEIPTASDIQAAAFDSESELTAVLDDNYLAASYVPAWSSLTGVPAGFSDNTDDGFTTEAELTALLDDNYLSTGYTPGWGDLTGIPSGFADNTDDVGFTTEAELTTLLNDNYLGTGYAPAWSDITGRPAGLDDGDDVGDATPDTIADDGVISDGEASNNLSIDNGLLSAPSGGGTVTVDGQLLQSVTKVTNGSVSTVTQSLERYIAEVTASESGRLMTLDTTIIHRLCRDDDGCSVEIQMVNWDTGKPNLIASRGHHLYISQTSNWFRWIDNDIEGLDNNNGVNEMSAWDCYFGDADTRINNNNGREDRGVGWGVLNAAGGYGDAHTSCRFVISD